MKAQISLEFLVYLSLAGASLLLASGTALHYLPKIEDTLNEYAVGLLVSKINALSEYYPNATLHAYIPKGMCNASIENSTLTVRSWSFYLNPMIRLERPFCPDGEYATLLIKRDDGMIIVGREE